jgi:hypothetical protein
VRQPLLLAIRLCVLAAFLGVPNLGAVPPDLSEDKRVFAAAGLKPDPAVALAVLRQREVGKENLAALAQAVQQLGSRKFTVRQKATRRLLSAGPAALPLLRQALHDRDAERARLARQCLEQIENGPGPRLTEALARLVGRRRPAGAGAALLGALLSAEDSGAEETMREALAAVSLTGGKAGAEVEAAARDAEPSRRAAAAFVLGRATDPAQRRRLARLLNDSHPEVRWQAASALVTTGARDAVPVLVALLEEARPWTAWRAEAVLRRLAADKAPQTALQATPASRRACRAAWAAWWKANSARADLRRLRQPRPSPLFLVADVHEGELLAFGHDRKECWRLTELEGPIDAQFLPSGRVLVVENHARRVTERDQAGRVVWEHKTRSLPASCRRLANGNTFIATREELLEVTPEHRTAWSRKVAKGIWSARRLRNGGFAVLTRSSEVLTLNPEGIEVHSKALDQKVGHWAGLSVLPNGNFCVAPIGDALELSPQGQVVRICPPGCSLAFDRLPDGRILTCDVLTRNRVVELDQKGEIVGQYKVKGFAWRVLVVRGETP